MRDGARAAGTSGGDGFRWEDWDLEIPQSGFACTLLIASENHGATGGCCGRARVAPPGSCAVIGRTLLTPASLGLCAGAATVCPGWSRCGGATRQLALRVAAARRDGDRSAYRALVPVDLLVHTGAWSARRAPLSRPSMPPMLRKIWPYLRAYRWQVAGASAGLSTPAELLKNRGRCVMTMC